MVASSAKPANTMGACSTPAHISPALDILMLFVGCWERKSFRATDRLNLVANFTLQGSSSKVSDFIMAQSRETAPGTRQGMIHWEMSPTSPVQRSSTQWPTILSLRAKASWKADSNPCFTKGSAVNQEEALLVVAKSTASWSDWFRLAWILDN